MKTIVLEVGQRVIADGLLRYTQYNGRAARVTKPFGSNAGTDKQGKLVQKKDTYEIQFSDGQLVVVEADQIALAPPMRGDMDQKVKWAALPPAVTNAMKGE